MGILAGIVIAFSLIQLAVAIFNRLNRPVLPASSAELCRATSILIPARNEEHTLPLLLSDLMRLPHPPGEILICDDHSDDHTYDLVVRLSRGQDNLRIFRSEPLPAGWLGKNFACYQLARRARGKYLLFLDADVRIGREAIGPLLARAQELHTGLLSVFPRQIMLTAGEKATVPLMTYILLSLLPLALVYRVTDQPALSAANGQFMLFEAGNYRRLQPHREVKDRAVEDVAISRLYKKAGLRVDCLTGIPGISCRMYTSRPESIAGFARSIAGFFGDSLLLALLFWLLTGWGWLVIVVTWSWTGLIFYLLLRSCTRFLIARTACQSPAVNLWWSFPQQWNLGLILLHAITGRIKGREIWKGRNIITPKRK